MKLFSIRYFLVSFLLTSPLFAQDSATIRGRLVNQQAELRPVEMSRLKLQLIQKVKLPTIPGNPALFTMNGEQRRNWFRSFLESEAGKEYTKERDRLLENRIIFDIDVDPDGSFELASVPEDAYELRGYVEKEFDGKTFAFEISVGIDVENKEAIRLGDVPISINRDLQIGERMPQFELASFVDPNEIVRQSDFENRFLLIYVWGLESELSLLELENLERLRKTYAADSTNVSFLGICLDDKKAISAEFLKYRNLDWHAASGGRQSDVIQDLGVRTLPYYCLVNPSGEIVVTNEFIHKTLRSTNMDLKAIIDKSISGDAKSRK